MKITKMHACGNDFVLLEYLPDYNYSELAIKLCNRRLGIGAEGLIVLKNNPLEMILYNPEGKKELMNGNAIRCFAKYCIDERIIRKNNFEVITGSGIIDIEVVQEIPFLCTVNLGKPIFNNAMVYVNDVLDCFGRIITINDMEINSFTFNLAGVNTVIFVPDFDSKYLNYAEEISKYKIFMRGTNVTYAKIVNKTTIDVKTYEHGIGFVLANGAGAAAALVAANKLGLTKLKSKINVELGVLEAVINKKGYVNITGPANTVFSCEYNEEEN